MLSKPRAKSIIDIFASKVSLLILGAITVWLGAGVAKEVYRKHQVREEIDKLKAEIVNLEKKNNNLASLLESFDDPSTIEIEAKKRLNLKRSDEEVAVILRDKEEEPQNLISNEIDEGGGVATTGSNNPPNPIKWWRYIVGE